MTRYNPRTGQPETYQAGPYDSAHWYAQVGGKLPSGVEEWSNGFRFAISGGAPVVVDDAGRTAMANAFRTFYTSSFISAGVSLQYMKLNPIETTGHYPTGTSSNTYLYTGNPAGTGTLTDKPFQNTIAVSWLTGVARGLGHTGRIYLPCPSLASDAGTGKITTASGDTVKTAATTLLNALNAAIPNLNLAVFSRKSGSPLHRGVTGVRVGLVWDTQRRRRNKLIESYR